MNAVPIFPIAMSRVEFEALQCDYNLLKGTGRKRINGAVIALGLALVAAHASNAMAATPEQLKPWLGCYEVAISTDERPVDTRILRLTDSPVEGTGG
ncbi:MAG: hypothetical protein ABIW82_11050, partial [Dokdonella sp.]